MKHTVSPLLGLALGMVLATMVNGQVFDRRNVGRSGMEPSLAGMVACLDKSIQGGSMASLGLLGKVDMTKNELTRGQMAQILYAVEKRFQPDRMTFDELRRLLGNLEETKGALDAEKAFSDVGYRNPNSNAICHAVAWGLICPRESGVFGVDDKVSQQELEQVLRRFSGDSSLVVDRVSDAVAYWCGAGDLGLAGMVGLNVYKQAREALAAKDMPKELGDALRKILDDARRAGRPQGQRTDVVGTKDDMKTWISRWDEGPFLREVNIKGLKPNTEPVEIVQVTDTHYNLVNKDDEIENNPSVMSTRQYRRWLRNGTSVPTIRNVLKFARHSDQTVVTGDILDYLSWGCLQLTVEEFFWTDINVLACLGGHDVTRVMQGKVKDPTSRESRLDILATYWPHDIFYVSKVVKDKVLLVAMFNDLGRYSQGQADALKADLERARRDNLAILIFQHEPICTRNPAEKSVMPIRRNDTEAWNFCDNGAGKPNSAPTTLQVYELIVKNADVVKGVFCGHMHSDYYTEIIASYQKPNGETVQTTIPQIVSTGSVYDRVGHAVRIVVE